jgi:hypothetical protein
MTQTPEDPLTADLLDELKREHQRTRERICVIGTTGTARMWTPEELAEWLRDTGCPSERAAWIMEQLTNPPPVTVVRIDAKEPA